MLDLTQIRQQFPALSSGAIHLDNPGGTQMARHAIDRLNRYIQHTNANHGGVFRTSKESDATLDEARRAMAEWLNARRPEEIVFGMNMTTLTLHMSRSLARRLQPGDEIIVTRLDHDANVAPWLMIAEDRGAVIRYVDFDPEDCTLNWDTFVSAINRKTKIVAIGYASNAVGTINDVRRAAKLAHSVGALVYVDAVQYVAHGITDVQDLDCDFLACSAYKFFGPHIGILYGKYQLLDELPAYKVRTSSKVPPEKWETGTQSFEGIAATLGAIEYFEWVGQTFGQPTLDSRRGRYMAAMNAIRSYESDLSKMLIEGLQAIPGVRVYGITEANHMRDRVSTVSITVADKHPREVAQRLADENIYIWNGNFYALEVTTRLGLENKGGLIRIGAVHYNTRAEIETLVKAIERIARS